MIFGGPEAHATKRRAKLVAREIYAAAPAVLAYLQWLESAITFDRADHPDHMPHPGRLLLIVMPIIGKKCLSRVLMDGGSGLNIFYADTLDVLGIKRSNLRQTQAPFYGEVARKSTVPLGQIMLPVTFRDKDNFCASRWSGSVGPAMPSWGSCAT